MKCVAIFAIMAVFAAAEFSDLVEEIEFTQEEAATESLSSAVSFLQNVSPSSVNLHVKRIAKHAELLQNTKAAAYSHNFAASKAAIKSALRALHTEMEKGHEHDKNALSSEKTRLNNNVASARNGGRNAVHGYRAKVCPEKRKEEAANAKEAAANRALSKVKTDRVCDPEIKANWNDMDIEKTSPKMGTALRNAWDKARARWVAAKNAHDAAKRAARAAKEKREKAMASFTTSLGIEASNAHTACRSASNEFTTLCKDVQTNVKTREQTYIATLVINCYVDDMTNKAKAKTCADKKRKASVARWAIACGSTTSCPGTAHWKNAWGPTNWQPTVANCNDSAKALPSAGGIGDYNGLNCPSGYTQHNGKYCGTRYAGTKRKGAGKAPVVEQLAKACHADKQCKGFDLAFSDNRYGHMCKAPWKITAYGIYKLCVKK